MKKRKKEKKSPIKNSLMILIFLSGLLLFSYPILSNIYASFFQTRVIDTYQKEVDKQSQDDKTDSIKDMKSYNKKMVTGKKEIGSDPFQNEQKSEKEPAKKHQVIDALEDELGDVLGYITIEKLNVKLPLYNGTSDYQLQKGIGVLAGTSLPIGGKGSHSVLTGHRGLPTSKLFSDLPNLKLNDTFSINILGETHEYRVDQIKTVLPEDISDLAIDPNEDYITLLTCTPYMINTHRLLVRGTRIATPKSEQKQPLSFTYVQWLNLLFVILALIELLMMLLINYRSRQKRDKKR